MCEVNRNDGMALPAPNMADRMSGMMMGDSPTPLSRKQPKNAVKHQLMSTRYIPLPNGRTKAIVQHSNGHPKPKICLPRWQRLPFKGESVSGAANSYTPSSSGQPMPQKLVASPNKVRSGNGDKPVDTSNKSEMLVIVSIESEGPASSGVPHVRLGGESWHADNANGPRDQVDVSRGQVDKSEGQTDESTGQTDTLNTSSRAGMTGISHCVNVGTYLGARDVKRVVVEIDGIGSHVDVSTGHEDAHSIVTHQTCLVLWTWRKLADETNAKNAHPRSVERLSRLEGYRQPSLSISRKVKTILMRRMNTSLS